MVASGSRSLISYQIPRVAGIGPRGVFLVFGIDQGLLLPGAGTSMSEANYTGVWLSGFALGPCNVQELGGGVRQRLGAKMAGVQKNMGEIMSYTLEAGGVGP
eukprot:642723-Rhodomonas_salina.1